MEVGVRVRKRAEAEGRSELGGKNEDERFVWGCRYTVEYPSVDNRQGVTFDLKSHQYGVATTIYTRGRCLANPPCGGPVAHFSPKARMHLDELLE